MGFKRIVSVCAASLFLFAIISLPLCAQQVTGGTLAGTVTDNSGAAVAGATVIATDLATNTPRTTTTNPQGHYIFTNIPPSTYSLQVSKQGFNAAVVPNLTVQVGSSLTQNVTLKVGAVNTTVTVSESAGGQLQTMNSTIGNTVTGTALNSLPSLGRDASTFVTLQPGVAPSGDVAGAVSDQSTFILDGGNNTDDMSGNDTVYTPSFGSDPTGGVAAGGGQLAAGNSGGVPTGAMPTPIDSVQEFKVNTVNQTADFNSSSGAEVEMVTKPGTNKWHGTAYDYYLNNKINANTWDNNNTGTPLPDYHYDRFGANLGGAIVPKEILGGKTYGFFMYEGFRWPNSQTYEATVPSAAMRAGIINGYNVATYDPRGIGINPVIQAMWNKYEPIGNDPGCTEINSGSKCDGVNEIGYIANMKVPFSSNFAVARIDHNFGEKWQFNTTYHYYRLERTTPNQVDIGGFFPGDVKGVPTALGRRPQEPWYYTASLTTTISSNTTNTFHYSFERNWWQWNDAGAPSQVPCATPASVACSAGTLEPFGEWAGTNNESLTPFNVNAQNIRTRFWDGKDHMLRDDISMLHGNHLFQFGGLYQHNFDFHQRTDNGGGINNTLTYQLGDSVGAGSIDMSSIYGAGFNGGAETVATDRDLAAVMGMVTESQTVFTRTGPNLALQPLETPAFDRQTIPFYNVYFSDTWHMKPTFTLTYGLGWTLEMPPVEAQGKSVDVVGPSGQQLDVLAYLHQREIAALQGQVFNPTIGFALVGNTGSGNKYPYNPFYGSFSPRISAAWNPNFSGGMLSRIFGTNSTVVRGGYDRIYGRLNGVDLVLVPLLGVGPMQAVQCTAVLRSGVCGGSGTALDPTNAFRIGIDGSNPPLSATPVTPTLPQPDYPGVNAVAAAAGQAFDPHFRPNVVDSIDFSVQRQFGPKAFVEVGYIGRFIHHEYQPYNINAVPYMMTMGGQSFAQAYAAVETAMGCTTSYVACNAATSATTVVAPQPFFETALAGTGYCTPGTCTATVVANEFSNFQTQSVWSLWSDLDQGGTAAGFNFPRSMLNSPLNTPFGASGQLTSGVALNASQGYGNHNGAFVTFRTTDWHGLTTQQNFTWSKALGTGAFVQASSEYTPNDPFNLGEMYGRQVFDYEKVYNLYITYAPSMYKGENGVRGRLLGGWSIAPIFAAGSGAPLYCNTQNDGQAFGEGDAVNFFSNEQCIFAHNPGTPSIHITKFAAGDPNCATAGPCESANFFTDPTAIANMARPPILGLDKRDNGVGIVSNSPYWNTDLQITKTTKITERYQIVMQAMFLNVFNHDQLGNPGADPFDLANSPDQWGNAGQQYNAPRQMEFGLRLNF